MADLLPPVPIGTPASAPAVWSDWYNRLRNQINGGLAVLWAQIDKSGSHLSDLSTRAHSELTSILGSGSYHLTQTAASRMEGYTSSTVDPTTADVAVGAWVVWRNTSSGVVQLWCNNNGTMKSVALA